MRPHLIISALLAVGLVPTVALASPSATKKYKAALLGSNVVPKQGPASGNGTARFTVNGLRVCWKITISGIDTPLAAHVHRGTALSTGPVIVALGKHFKPVGCTAISEDAALAIGACNCGGVYVDVHTKKFPKGAIRGALELSR
jgi:hypothetical protein